MTNFTTKHNIDSIIQDLYTTIDHNRFFKCDSYSTKRFLYSNLKSNMLILSIEIYYLFRF